MDAGATTAVLCPLYRKNKATSIYCEGITDRCSVQIRYSTLEDVNCYLDQFCKDHFKRCEMYAAIMRSKYADYYAEEQHDGIPIGR